MANKNNGNTNSTYEISEPSNNDNNGTQIYNEPPQPLKNSNGIQIYNDPPSPQKDSDNSEYHVPIFKNNNAIPIAPPRKSKKQKKFEQLEKNGIKRWDKSIKGSPPPPPKHKLDRKLAIRNKNGRTQKQKPQQIVYTGKNSDKFNNPTPNEELYATVNKRRSSKTAKPQNNDNEDPYEDPDKLVKHNNQPPELPERKPPPKPPRGIPVVKKENKSGGGKKPKTHKRKSRKSKKSF